MVPCKVKKISYDSINRCYAVILKNITSSDFFSVNIGSVEAQSIALAIESVNVPRPLTHDLICDILKKNKIKLKTVRINDIVDGVYIAELETETKNNNVNLIDARPSDAIAIALRMNAPILANKKVFDNEVDIKNANSDIDGKEQDLYSVKVFKDKLQNAIQKEEYEIAAKIRDKLSELES